MTRSLSWLPLLAVCLLAACHRKAPEIPMREHAVTLTWHASASRVTGYRVYRRELSRSTPVLLATTAADTIEYKDPTAKSGYTYEYVVTSIDAAQKESATTARIYVTIPVP